MMQIPDIDFQKIADDFKRISEAFELLLGHEDKNEKLFNITLDLSKRELDRLFLDLTQIWENTKIKEEISVLDWENWLNIKYPEKHAIFFSNKTIAESIYNKSKGID
ncbi:MAG: hypothetical protein M0R03_08755 [Novosphingobium sp.]|nr:hypothetical protein [Novosphingobium sp.]